MPAIAKSAMRTIAKQKSSQRYQDAKARRACCDVVWDRNRLTVDRGRCERCNQSVYRSANYYWLRGHVHETLARSLGGDNTDPQQCELLCHSCHFNGPSGAHRRSVRAV